MAAQYRFIVTSTELSGVREATVDGKPAREHFQTLRNWLDTLAGSSASSLFALPETGFSRARGLSVVTWYTTVGDPLRPLDTLSGEEAAAAEALLADRLAELVGSADPAMRRLLRAAFQVPATSDIFVGPQAVVLTNWGILPAGADPSDAVSTSALQRFLPPGFGLAPVPGEADERSVAADSSGLLPGAAAAAAPEGHVPARPAATERAAPPPFPSSSGNTSEAATAGVAAGWQPSVATLAGVSVFLALVLIYLLWPGNLIYLDRGDEPDNQLAVNLTNERLEADIARLQASLGENACRADIPADLDRLGGMPVIDSLGPPGAAETSPPSTGAEAPGAGEAPPAPLSPRSEAPPTGSSTSPVSTETLLGKLDAGTVFILGAQQDGLSMGSGMLVAPDLVLTNYHVVESGDPTRLFVSNQAMGRTLEASLVGRSSTSNISSRDFALLRLSQPSDLPRLRFTTQVARLDGVIAAGFPSFVLSSDPSFVSAMQSGEPGRLSELQMAVTRGEVTAEQAGADGSRILVHSATISPGNSGGPLVDMCGRIVGINTYTRTDTESALRLNFALSARDALTFLAENGVTAESESNGCAVEMAAHPGTSSPLAAPPASDPPAPAPAALPAPAAVPAPAPAPQQADAPPVAPPPVAPGVSVLPSPAPTPSAPAGSDLSAQEEADLLIVPPAPAGRP
jgi:S1-C subfamily serine protease